MLLFSFAYLIAGIKKQPVSFFLTGIVIITMLLALLIGKYPIINDVKDLANWVFIGLLLFTMIHSFWSYNNLKIITKPEQEETFKFIVFLIKWIGFFTVLINGYIVYKSFGLLLYESINVNEYKNQGGSIDYINKWVNPKFLFASRLFTPFGYIALGLHFYFLTKNDFKSSIVFLIISLAIPLQGLQALSRSAPVQYILMYIIFFCYSYKAIDKKYKYRMMRLMLMFFVIFVILLGLITSSRFGSYYNVPKESKIKNSALYSLIDYAAQWNTNSVELLDIYEREKILLGKSSFPIYDFVLQKLGKNRQTLHDARLNAYENYKYATRFNGVSTSLIFDYGYFFAIIFVLIFFRIVRFNSPQKGEVSLSKFLSFAVTVPLPLMFFGNNIMSYVIFNLAIIYTFMISVIIKYNYNLKNIFK